MSHDLGHLTGGYFSNVCINNPDGIVGFIEGGNDVGQVPQEDDGAGQAPQEDDSDSDRISVSSRDSFELYEADWL